MADRICAGLERRGVRCWMASRNLEAGENFAEVIVRQIQSSKVLLILFSANANNSAEMMKEVVLADQNKLTVMPARIADIQPSGAFAYQMATRQWIDLFPNWDDAVGRLAARIIAVLGPEHASAVRPLTSNADPARHAPPPGSHTATDNRRSGPVSQPAAVVADSLRSSPSQAAVVPRRHPPATRRFPWVLFGGTAIAAAVGLALMVYGDWGTPASSAGPAVAGITVSPGGNGTPAVAQAARYQQPTLRVESQPDDATTLKVWSNSGSKSQ